MKALFSFDVFDTLITRIVATPKGVFALMQERLKTYAGFPELFSAKFFEIRESAERHLRQVGLSEEVSIREIYSFIGLNYQLTEQQVVQLINLEVEIEELCCVGISANIQDIISLHSRGEHVILISDMYLSAQQVRRLLVHVDPVFVNIPIYTSSDCNTTKYNGGLFDYVRSKEFIGCDIWHHCGDNKHSDYDVPKSKGITCRRVEYANLLSHEIDALIENDPYIQLCIGSSRVLRVNSLGHDKIYAFGSSFSGPLLIDYVSWILNDAVAHGISCLAFVARDGYILKIIADIIVDAQSIPISTKYIYGSRKAWDVIGDLETENIVYSYVRETISSELKNTAFVESVGTGRMFENLNVILNSRGCDPIRCYYINCSGDPFSAKVRRYIFLPSFQNLMGIEALLRAPHGATIKYARADNDMNPVMVDDESYKLHDWGYDRYVSGISSYTKMYVNALSITGIKKASSDGTIIKAYMDSLHSFVPEFEFIECIGKIPFTDKIGDKPADFSPKYSLLHALLLYARLASGVFPPKLLHFRWSLTRSSVIWRFLFCVFDIIRLTKSRAKVYCKFICSSIWR